jgi:hypothetical protein
MLLSNSFLIDVILANTFGKVLSAIDLSTSTLFLIKSIFLSNLLNLIFGEASILVRQSPFKNFLFLYFSYFT